ncbi:MAG: histidine kinase dimerization/phosphoacceptor domain -containing protein [Bacteroidota bacterium]
MLARIIFILAFLLGFEKDGIASNNNLQKLRSKAYAHVNNKSDSAIFYVNKYLKYSTNNISFFCDAYILSGKAHLIRNNYSKSIADYKTALKNIDSNNLIKYRPYALLGLAVAYKNSGQYEKALFNYLKALEDFKERSDSSALASTLNSMASIYKRLENVSEAQNIYLSAFNIYKSINDTIHMASIFNNLGLLMKEKYAYDSALLYFQKAIEISFQLNDTAKQAIYTLNLGNIFLTLDQHDSSEFYSLKSFQLNKSINDKSGLAIVSNNLGNLYMAKKEWGEVHFYLNQAEELASEIGELETLKENYELWSTYYEEIGNSSKSLDYHKKLLIIKDSLLNQEKIRAISELQIQFETEQKEQEISFLNEQKQTQQALISQQNWFIWLLAISSVLFLVLSAVAYRSYSAKKRAHSKIELLLRELHHRVKNNLQMISSILSLQSENLSDQKAKAAIKEGEMRVNAMNLLHQRLYMDGTSSEVNIKDYLEELLSDLELSYAEPNRQVKLKTDIEPISVDVDKAIPLGLLTNELISNSYKHAFKDSGSGTLSVILSKNKEKVKLVVSDDGQGFKIDDRKNAESFGLRMVEILCQQLRAEKHFSNGKGSRFEFEIDLKG